MIGSIVPVQASGEVSGIPNINDGYTAPTQNTGVTPRFEVVSGGYKEVGNKVYVNMLLKVVLDMSASNYESGEGYDSYLRGFPKPLNNICVPLSCFFMYKNNANDYRYIRKCRGFAIAYTTADQTLPDGALSIGTNVAINGTASTPLFYCIVYGSYDI